MSGSSSPVPNLGPLLGTLSTSFRKVGRSWAGTANVHPDLNGPTARRLVNVGFAAATCEHGVRDLNPGRKCRLFEEKTLLFAEPNGPFLRAEAQEIHRESGLLMWRSTVQCGEAADAKEWMATLELTQTWKVQFAAHLSQPNVVPIDPREADAPFDRQKQSTRGGGSEERRKQILKAAYEVIANRGYANASMREIAQAADLPIATVYLYIKSKDELLFQISALLLDDMKEQFRKEIGSHTSAVETLSEAIRQYLLYCGRNRRFINLVYREGKSLSDENHRKILELDRSFVALWEQIILTGRGEGDFEVENPELFANYVYFLCTSWSIRHWNLKRFGEQSVRETITLFAMRALGVPEKKIRAARAGPLQSKEK